MRMSMAALGAVVALAVAGVESAAARPGDLDPSFGSAGEVVAPFAGFVSAGRIAQDTLGRTLVATVEHADDGTSRDIAVVRFDAAGALDATFGEAGFARIGTSAGEALAAMTVDRDDRALIAVASHVDGLEGPRGVITVVRLTSDGLLDTFGGGGAVAFPGSDVGFGPTELFAHADGAFDLVTWYCDRTRRCSLLGFTQTAEGAPLGSFRATEGLDDVVEAGAVMQANGRVVVAARVFDGVAFSVRLARYEPNGRLDRSFGERGRIDTGLPTSRYHGPVVTLARDGTIVAAGLDVDVAVVARFGSDGDHDLTFGTNGVTPITAGAASATLARALAVQPDGRVLIAGTSGGGGSHWFLAALDANGLPDRDFGVHGSVVRDPTGPDSLASELLLRPDGRIVVAGIADAGVTLARYLGFPRACGDANGDTTITVSDGVQVLRAAAGLASSCLDEFCDADASGAVTVTDGVRTLRAAGGLAADLRCIR